MRDWWDMFVWGYASGLDGDDSEEVAEINITIEIGEDDD